MDTNILQETFIKHPAETLQWIIFAGVLILGAVYACKKIYGWIENYRTKRNHADAMIKTMQDNAESIKEMRETMKDIVEKMDSMQTSLSGQIKDLDKRITDTAQTSADNDRAILKDRISQVYMRAKRKQHPYILDGEFDNYISMLERYEALDGNGEVHEKIDPFIRSLPMFFSDEEAEAHFKEMV